MPVLRFTTMYPNLYFAFKEWFGVELQWLKIFNTFGLMLALSFVAAAVVLSRELRRREKAGLLGFKEEKVLVGEPAGVGELLVNFIIGFLLGFKLIGGVMDGGLLDDPQSYIPSGKGNVPVGLLLGGLFAFLKWREKNKVKLAKPEIRSVRIWPHDRVGDFALIAAFTGLLGAKLFHFFENWGQFVKDPLGNLASTEGLTFYGGLIVAAFSVLWYARKKGVNLWHLVDSAAPALMIAYAVGRIGCQVSGDGDWGIHNTAYVSTPDAKVVLADSANNMQRIMNKDEEHTAYFNSVKEETGEVPGLSFKAPGFIPRWMVAMNYANNVNEAGVTIAGYDRKKDKYQTMLPVPVFPTPFYETALSFIFFMVLLRLRRSVKIPGVIFGIYLVMNGAERFLVEKIRVNTRYDIFGFHPTQAEIISTLLMLGGLFLIYYSRKKANAAAGA
jgi:phosphatidylglycerol---prolipoprotein diacylglyceryl transferase